MESLLQACRTIREDSRTACFEVSGLYLTEPVEGVEGDCFVNCAVLIDWLGSSADLLELCRECERQAGSALEKHHRARTLDADLLFFQGESVRTEGLTLPHPAMSGRRFVLEPLSDIAPEVVPTGLDQSIAGLLARCPEGGRVELLLAAEDVACLL
ncbi:2-amino-4-hydroxy-6-hydroxymethyldihydropteridine diphosphokinase [Candidatus Fermentibacterales bacterium]|nr:2-amino-4-hydroxy-6-hydroxymethyldihydropteridine diphosphokinase [Candidatus Fermentibacterales bacterium]